MARSRKRREPDEVEFDLTPMIDVTFLLIIFFLLQKFKQDERRQSANLSLTSGPSDVKADESQQITMRLVWEPDRKSMTYLVCRGDNKEAEFSPVDGGTLAELSSDRSTKGYPRYTNKWESLVDQMLKTFDADSSAKKIEITLTNDTQTSIALQSLDQQPPWGFVTLALDASTEFNRRLLDSPRRTLIPEEMREFGLEIVTKNSVPEAPVTRRN